MHHKKEYISFLASEFPQQETSLFHIVPVPMEGNGPELILEASHRLEVFDGKSIPAETGIYTHPPENCRGRKEEILNRVADRVEEIFQMERIPVLLGGDHSISNGAFLAILREIEKGSENVGIVQIDAHADLKESEEGSLYTDSSVMKRALDMGFPIYQMGVRSLSPGEMDLRKERNIPYRDASDLCSGNGVKEISLSPDFPEYIYLTIDADGLDPSVIPGTAYPEPGGLSWYQTLSLIGSLADRHRIIGFDIVGIAPGKDDQISAYTAAKLCYSVMGIIAREMEIMG